MPYKTPNGFPKPIVYNPEIIFDELETENLETMSSPMKEFYKGKTIFMSGGTGFVGLIMLEKLLRCDAKEIFLLTRSKKGKSAVERVEAIFNEPIYIRLIRKKDYYLKKITVVEGDLANPTLGIQPEMKKQIIERAEIVVHVAADVRFDETLKESVETNVRGTRELLKLSEKMTKLMSFLYLSTAYANCPQKRIKEKFYQTPMDPETMIKLCEQMSESDVDAINILTERIVNPWPNTYAYTKALSEELMRIYSKKLPIVVVRPSIIMMTYEDPIPGWLNNVYGINGVFFGVGMGILRIFYIDNKKHADIVPADIVSNASLAVIWHYVTKRNKGENNSMLPESKAAKTEVAPVFNCVNYVDNPLTWGEVKHAAVPLAKRNAILGSLWIGVYNTTKIFWVYYVLRIFYHIIPAFFFDLILKMQGQKPRVVNIYKRIHRFARAIAYFTNNEWEFENDNLREVLNSMSPVDKKYFLCDIKTLKWDNIFEIFGAGIRKYLGREPIDTWPAAQARYKRIQILHYLILILVYSFLAWLTFNILKFYGFIDYSYEYYLNVKNTFYPQ